MTTFPVSGIHSRAQRKTIEIYWKAIFVPCGNHSRSLAAVHAVGASEVPNFLISFHSYFTKCGIIRSLNPLLHVVLCKKLVNRLKCTFCSGILLSSAYNTRIWICALRATFTKNVLSVMLTSVGWGAAESPKSTGGKLCCYATAVTQILETNNHRKSQATISTHSAWQLTYMRNLV